MAMTVGLFLIAAIAQAQDSAEVTQLKAQLNKNFSAGDWDAFVQSFESIQQADTSAIAPALWYRLGIAQLNRKQYDAAREAYERADAAGFAPTFVAVGLAGLEAEAGNEGAAFVALGRAVDAGFTDAMILDSNPRLQSLHTDARYQQVRERMQEEHPCSRPECRQFDFWVGEWDVHGPNGGKAGTNSIQPMLNRCALQEVWTGASGGGGKSVNFYHPGKKKWVQIWVNGSGGVIEIEGEYADGAMRFVGQNIAADGSFEMCRASWTLLEDGRVRQFWEQSRDQGKTWYTWFDGYYSRKPDSSE